MTNKKLWQQVAAFRFDGSPSALTFSQRLARDNGWSPGYTGRVLEEYRRFLYLAVCAGHPVTPSDQVDQAWHLHLVYTRSYWEDLCGNVLRQPLHHGPTKGGASETAKFHDWYEATLSSYRREFDQWPPIDIWPDVRERFSTRAKFQRVDMQNAWLVSKPKLRTIGAMFAASLATIASPEMLEQSHSRPASAGVVLIVLIAVLVIVAYSRSNQRPPGSTGNQGGNANSGGCASSGCGGSSSGHSGCGSHHGGSGCGADSSGCSGSSGCGSSCGSGCGGGGD